MAKNVSDRLKRKSCISCLSLMESGFFWSHVATITVVDVWTKLCSLAFVHVFVVKEEFFSRGRLYLRGRALLSDSHSSWWGRLHAGCPHWAAASPPPVAWCLRNTTCNQNTQTYTHNFYTTLFWCHQNLMIVNLHIVFVWRTDERERDKKYKKNQDFGLIPDQNEGLLSNNIPIQICDCMV